MANKKAEKVGQGLGLLVGLVMVAALMGAILIPFFLLFRYLQHLYLSYKLRKDYGLAENGYWLTDEERAHFKAEWAAEKSRVARDREEHKKIESLIAAEHQKAEEENVATNMDGTYTRRSYIGREIQESIWALEARKNELRLHEYEVSCRQPREFWYELNDILKKKDIAFMALLGWGCGAFFLYSALQEGAPFRIWLYLLTPALCAGVGAAVAAIFSWNPAAKYMPRPVAITIENVDVPTVEMPQKSGMIVKFAGIIIWLSLMVFVGGKGRTFGQAEAISHREWIKQEEAKVAENERRMKELEARYESVPETADASDNKPISPGSSSLANQSLPESAVASGLDASAFKGILLVAHKNPIDPVLISRMNSAQVEDVILSIYARYGAIFESAEAQKWANDQSWYEAVPDKTIKDAEKEFSFVVKTSVNRLVEHWNRIQVEEGLAALPVDESPLAGRGVSPDIEQNVGAASAPVLRALPVDGSSPAVHGNLDYEEMQNWNLARVRYEINRIYAHHGVVFPQKEIQEHFEKQPWYKPVKDLTFDQAEKNFSEAERLDIAALAERRTLLAAGNQPLPAIPVSEPLTFDLISTWDAARLRHEINSIYASYGVDFTNAELRKWAENQPGYKCVPGRTFEDAEKLFTDTDRRNIELLATRRTQINSGN